jgi:hypothetical protein
MPEQKKLQRNLINPETVEGLIKFYQKNDSDEKIVRVIKSVLLLCSNLEEEGNLDKVIDFITNSLKEESLELYQYNQILKLFEKFHIPLRVQDRLYFRAGIDGFNKAAEAFIAYGEANKIPFHLLFKLLTTIFSLAASYLLGDDYHKEVNFNQKNLIKEIVEDSLNKENLLAKYSFLLEELDLLSHMIIMEKNLALDTSTFDELWDNYNLTNKLQKIISSKIHKKNSLLQEKFQSILLAIKEKYKKLEVDLILKLLKNKNLLAILNNPDYKNLLSYSVKQNNFNRENIFATDFLSKLFRTRDLAKARQSINNLIPQENLSFASVKDLVNKARKIMIREKNLSKVQGENSSISLVNA